MLDNSMLNLDFCHGYCCIIHIDHCFFMTKDTILVLIFILVGKSGRKL